MKYANSIPALVLLAAVVCGSATAGCSSHSVNANAAPSMTLPPTINKQAVMDNPRLSPQAKEAMANGAKGQ